MLRIRIYRGMTQESMSVPLVVNLDFDAVHNNASILYTTDARRGVSLLWIASLRVRGNERAIIFVRV